MDRLYVSAAQADITPPLGSRFAGHLNRDKPAEGILDPLYGRVLYLRAGGSEALIVNCDLLEFGEGEARSIRASLAKSAGIAEDRVLLTATHTHTGPPTLPFSGLPSDGEYVAWLVDRLEGCTRGLKTNAQPCRFSIRKAQVRLSCNRRKKVGGKIVMAPNPEGPVDPDLTLVLFRSLNGEVLGGIAHYAMHPTTLSVHSYQVSADYPGRFLRHLRDQWGKDAVFLFLQGACGDLKPAVFDEKGNFKEGEEEDIESLGRRLAEAAGQAPESASPMSDQDLFQLTVLTTPFLFRFHPLPTEESIQRELEALNAFIQEHGQGRERPPSHIDPLKQAFVFRDWALRWKETLSRKPASQRTESSLDFPGGDLPRYLRRELTALCLGEIGFLFVPGELFCATGLAIKTLSTLPHTCVVCYADATVGYVPTRQSLEEGGYESQDAYKYYGYPAPFHPDTEPELIQVATRLLSARGQGEP